MKTTLLITILLIVTTAFTYAKTTCSQFQNWEQADKYYKAKKPGYKSLDRNNDGQPCESLWKDSLNKKKQASRLRIYKYGGPHSYGKTFSSMSACEKARVKLTKSNAGSDYSYKCESK